MYLNEEVGYLESNPVFNILVENMSIINESFETGKDIILDESEIILLEAADNQLENDAKEVAEESHDAKEETEIMKVINKAVKIVGGLAALLTATRTYTALDSAKRLSREIRKNASEETVDFFITRVAHNKKIASIALLVAVICALTVKLNNPKNKEKVITILEGIKAKLSALKSKTKDEKEVSKLESSEAKIDKAIAKG